MTDQEDDLISRNHIEWEMPVEKKGAEEAARGWSLYQASKTRRGRGFLALLAVLFIFLVWAVGWFVENTDNLIFIVFGVLVTFGSMALYLARGMRKFDQKLVDQTETADRRTVILGTIVTVLIVVGIPALVVWLYTQIDVLAK